MKPGESPSRKATIVRTGLEALIATCDDMSEGLRDRVLTHFVFASGGRRPGEDSAADRGDLRLIGPDQ